MRNDSGMTPKNKLLRIYRLFDEWAGEYNFACGEGCATCCTRSVTMTSLEGEVIRDYINGRPELLARLHNLPVDAPTPILTTNGFAAACFREEEIANGSTTWDMRPCVFLDHNRCPIYPVRSFMCRSFGSQVRCREDTAAVVSPLYLTLTTVIMQCIEHLDQGNPWGNMLSILHCQSLTGPQTDLLTKQLPRAEPIPGFFIPPGEADRLSDQIRTLMGLL